MNCPIDNTLLAITDRQGVEIDYCPKCRGVWLDRGELDKIIDKSEAYDVPGRERYEEEPHKQKYREASGPNYRKSKKESFLGDLFDF
jgi:hypothetical protein